MPKTIPACPEKPAKRRPAEESRPFAVELVTPMFGGGVQVRVNDATHPIRETAVRGQLEFWWRATRGYRFTTVPDLRAEQTRIWGNTETPSKVRVVVDRVAADDPAPAGEIRWDAQARQGRGGWRLNWHDPFQERDSALPYALFPFQGKVPPSNPNARVEEPPASCIRRASFRLTVSCEPQFWVEVEAALWAWVNFGGMGGRTRRGCGAVYCKDFAPPTAPQVEAWLKERFAAYGLTTAAGPAAWPQLAAAVLVRPEGGSAVETWNWVVGRFREFRQGKNLARDPGGARPGRSRYPEPNTIRDATGVWDHPPQGTVPLRAFPRAELGLPIVFHFQGQGVPPDTILSPVVGGTRRERMASPLILKPLQTADGTAVPLIMRLRAPQVDEVELTGPHPKLPVRSSVIRDPGLATYKGPDSPLTGLSANGSAVEGFLAFATNVANGFQRV